MKNSVSVEDIDVLLAMKTIKEKCEGRPTCEGCKRRFDHAGCYFRNKSPREWDLSIFESEDKNE